MKKEFLFYQVLIISLVIAIFICFMKIENTKTDIQLIEHSHLNDIKRLETQISSIYDNIDKQLKKESSLFSSITRDFGELNPNTGMADIHISVMPKVIRDDMSINITLFGKTAKMEKSENNVYKVTIPVNLFEEGTGLPLVTVLSNGETKTEYLENHGIENISSNYLPSIHRGSINPSSVKFADGKLTVEGHFSLGYYTGDTDKKAEFVNYALIAEVSGKQVANEDITALIKQQTIAHRKQNSLAYGEIDIQFNETYNLTDNDTLSIYIIAEDSLGFIHKKLAFSWQHSDDSTSPDAPFPADYDSEIIHDKNGNPMR